MKTITLFFVLPVVSVCMGLSTTSETARAQDGGAACRPDPREIPVPRIVTATGRLPGVDELPVRNEMPDVMMMNDGTRVTARPQWQKRREEIKRVLEYYAVGQAPPPPGNVKGRELRSEIVLEGGVQYRLVRLTFGPGERQIQAHRHRRIPKREVRHDRGGF